MKLATNIVLVILLIIAIVIAHEIFMVISSSRYHMARVLLKENIELSDSYQYHEISFVNLYCYPHLEARLLFPNLERSRSYQEGVDVTSNIYNIWGGFEYKIMRNDIVLRKGVIGSGVKSLSVANNTPLSIWLDSRVPMSCLGKYKVLIKIPPGQLDKSGGAYLDAIFIMGRGHKPLL